MLDGWVPGGQRDQESGWWVLCDLWGSSQQEVGLLPPLFSPRRAHGVPSSPGDALQFPLLLSWTHGQEPEVGFGLATVVPAAWYRGSPRCFGGVPGEGLGGERAQAQSCLSSCPQHPAGHGCWGARGPSPYVVCWEERTHLIRNVPAMRLSTR